MKNYTPFTTGSFSLVVKKIILSCCLVTGITTMTWAQATLNSSFPANAKVCIATNATFKVAATATGTITYQWQESTDGGITFTPLVENSTPGANPANGIYTGTQTSTLTITRAPSTIDGRKYQAIVYVNGINPVVSNAATLNVSPSASLDDASSTNCPSTIQTLNSGGTAGASYQWQVSSNGGSSWTNIVDGADPTGVTYSGSTSNLVISPLTTAIDGYKYRYTANDNAGCTITSGVTTQLVPALAVTNLPTAGSITATVGQTVSIPATVTAGTGPFTYQWQSAVGAGAFSNIATSNTSYTGQTSNTLVIPSVTAAMFNNRYRVIVKNAGGCTAASTNFIQIGLMVVTPLTIEDFTAEKQEGSAVKLMWTVDPAFAASSYTVQRSPDGLSFTDAGSIKGETGKTEYGFTDEMKGSAVVQYRIKMTSQDGMVVYSGLVKITDGAAADHIELRPSFTAGGLTNLFTSTSRSEAFILTVTDVMGRRQFSQSVKLEKGEHYTPLDVSRLSKGLYFVNITSPDGISKTLSFVKN